MMHHKNQTILLLLCPLLFVGLSSFVSASSLTSPVFPKNQQTPQTPATTVQHAKIVDMLPEDSKPPLSEEEIFPHLKSPQDKKEPQKADSLEEDQNLTFAQKKQREEDKLFYQLKRTADVQQAAQISRSLEGLWQQSGSSTVDLLMEWTDKQIANENYAVALDFLDNVVALAPDYAEGWMRRASVHLMQDDTALAMVELNRVLQLNPRHYNAMFLLGGILKMTDRNEQALAAFQKVLFYYPQMQSAQRKIGELIEENSSQAL